MRKKLTSFILVFTVAIFMSVLSPVTVTNAKEKATISFQQSTKDLDPLQIQYLNSRGVTELVGQTTSYYKLKVQDSSKNRSYSELTNKDFVVEKSTESEYEASKLKTDQFSTNSVPGLWEDNNLDNYVKVMLSVFRDPNNNNKFTITNNFAWTRYPNINVTDAFGVRVHPSMVIIKDSIWGFAQGTFEVGGQTYYENILKTGTPVYKELGAGYEVTPKGAYSTNSGFMVCDAYFSQLDAGNQIGSVIGYYISTTIGSNLSIGADGMPSIGFELSNDTFEASVNVYNY